MKKMKKWTVKGYLGANYEIEGGTLVEAIENGFRRIVADNRHNIGNAAGYVLVSVTAVYREGILGGKGGVELTIRSKGEDLAHMPASDEIQTAVVWIYAKPEDLPTPHEFVAN